jgi:archaellum component FlaC
MGIWEKANKVDEIQSNIACVKHVLELIAQDLQDPHSGAIWACHDMLAKYTEELELIVNDLMDDVKEMNELRDKLEELKAKKKKAK